jgi:AraC family transcriptional regulator
MAAAIVTRDGPPRDARDIEDQIAVVSGARAVWIVDKPGSVVAEHRHDWPILSLFITGDYLKVSEAGATRISSPAAVLHAAGAPHGSVVGQSGAEQLDIEFDPAWAGLDTRKLRPVHCWIGGAVAASARKLAALWTDGCSDERRLRVETEGLLTLALHPTPERAPDWLPSVVDLLRADHPLPTTGIAAKLGLHPGWLAQEYRRAVAAMLHTHAAPHAQIAIEAGFCDQSHMIRSFRAVLGRTPAQVEREIDD